MPEKVMPGPVQDTACIREAVCIHTKKIYDSCKEEDIAFFILILLSPKRNSPRHPLWIPVPQSFWSARQGWGRPRRRHFR